ncbi:hypothetical protein RDI58_007896 [Solanum bulbocastanum]|uniref:Uncharacterized protein n=1 Tax=Solanum bulbocastanum TaxID=147425 RepID=A0AAN8YML3_SOLBU
MVGGSYYTSSPSTSMAVDLWETLKDFITALALAISFTLLSQSFLVHQIMLAARDFDEQMQP